MHHPLPGRSRANGGETADVFPVAVLRPSGERSLLATLGGWVVLAGLVLAVLSVPAGAQSLTDRVVLHSGDPDPYAADPLGLVAHFGLTSYRGTAPDRFEVWVCDGVHGSLDLTPENVTGLLNAELPAFYLWLSERRYALSFVPGGAVRANSQQGCLDSVGNRSTGGNHAAIVVSTLHLADASNISSLGGPGSRCWDDFASYWLWCEFYPENQRWVWMGWFTNVGVRWSPIALSSIEDGIGSLDALHALDVISTVAHEIGHTLSWPHSFTGTTMHDDGAIDEYDNPMDLMSGGPTATYEDDQGTVSRRVLAGTHVLNRYAAGWVQSDQVEFHPWHGLSLHAINSVGSPGTQMVIMQWSKGVFESIGVRVKDSYDSLVPKEGVEIYRVDQSADQCDNPFIDVCWGLDRRTKPSLSGEDDPVLHVLGLGEGVYWGDSETDPDRYELNVIERYGDAFIIEIAPGDYPSFADVPYDDFFYVPVRWAQSGEITAGVGENRFGVRSGLKREEMITFLCRAYAPDECRRTQFDGSAYFADVPGDHWANTTIGWAVENGITSGVGNGLFGMGQTLTREQTMAFLYRAEGAPDTGTVGKDHYDDVPGDADAWYQTPIGWSYEQGITGGTAAGTFGFRSTPFREETMLFMCRTLDPAICPPSKEPVTPTTRKS